MALYQPGNEPDKLRERLERYFGKMAEAYPDKVVMGLAKDHKEWAKQATDLRRKLGYEDNKSFFEAYGFKYEFKACTPVAALVNDDAVIATLKERYKDEPLHGGVRELQAANPDLSGNLQTLYNRSNQTFGMPFKQYLMQEGIITGESKKMGRPKQEKKIIEKPDPRLLIGQFIEAWENDGCKQYKSVSDFKENCPLYKTALNTWTFDAYHLTLGSFLEISGMITVEKREAATNEEKSMESHKAINKDTREPQLKYYSPFNDGELNLDELKGKEVLISDVNKDTQTMLRSVLKRHGASAKMVFSENVDYFVTYINPYKYKGKGQYVSDDMEQAVKQHKSTGKPIFINPDTILAKEREFVSNQIASLTKEEKLEYAISVYSSCVKDIYSMMTKKGFGEYFATDSLCSGDSVVSAYYKGNDLSEANDFFNKIKKNTDNYSMLCSLYEKVFEPRGCNLEGYLGVETAVAISVAGFVYGNTDCKVYIEWMHDKWELRGEYRTPRLVGFTISAIYPHGKVLKISQAAYEWE